MLTKSYLQKYYTTCKPDWVIFCERLINLGFTVCLYISQSKSKYITIIHNNKMIKVRYSNHSPNIVNWVNSDVKFSIGPEHKGMLRESEVLDAVRLFFV